MMLCLSFLKDKPILLFFAAFFILSVWEYIVGVILEKLFKTKYWDYSHLKFNIQGRVFKKFYILGNTWSCIYMFSTSFYRRIYSSSTKRYITIYRYHSNSDFYCRYCNKCICNV
jgi:hypothetical protein